VTGGRAEPAAWTFTNGVMMQDHKPMRVAVVGLGTVGTGVIRLLDANRDLIARRAGRPIEVRAVNARDRNRDRGVDISRFDWVDDMMELARRDDIDVVVELIGGSDGPALALARAALEAGKPLVTANKAMLAHHGLALAGLAEKSGIPLKYEAAVAGGIPVIKGLREGAAANEISRVYGILNGTCNYILTTMEKEGRDFGEVLKEAQELGYAEADPSFDVDGVDAAHKLSILASLAFGTQIDFGSVDIGGIRSVSAADIREAGALGYRIRLVGMAENRPNGLFQRVHPVLVPVQHPLANVDGSLNAVLAEGNFVGSLFFSGRGAGEGPTASAVVADLIDIARDEYGDPFAMQVGQLAQRPKADSGDNVGRVYLRFMVRDKPGVLAEIAAAMRDAGVSIESVIQRGAHEDGSVLLVVVTHDSSESAIAETLRTLSGSDNLLAEPVVMPILD
jgi:homoserine dehydrogenase